MANLTQSESLSDSRTTSNNISAIGSGENNPHWWRHTSKQPKDQYVRNFKKQFTGRPARKYFRRIWRPSAPVNDLELGNHSETYLYGMKDGKQKYTNQWNETVKK